MAKWLNRTAGTSARNGTSSHTITFTADGDGPFTPADGNLLVVIVAGAVTTSWPGGWTEQLQPVNNTELSVATITASSTTAVTVTHNASDYPVHFAVYEFPAGSTWTAGIGQQNVVAPDPQPTLTGLPGTPVTVVYGFSGARSSDSSANAMSLTWPSPAIEDVELDTLFTTSEGVFLGVAYTDDVTDTTATVTPVPVLSGIGVVGASSERVTFALTVAAPVVASSGPAVFVFGADPTLYGRRARVDQPTITSGVLEQAPSAAVAGSTTSAATVTAARSDTGAVTAATTAAVTAAAASGTGAAAVTSAAVTTAANVTSPAAAARATTSASAVAASATGGPTRAELPVGVPTRAGLNTVYTTAAAAGNYFPNDGRTYLILRNTGGVDRVVTVRFAGQRDGDPITGGIAITVPAGAERTTGVWRMADYRRDDGSTWLDYDAATGLSVCTLSV